MPQQKPLDEAAYRVLMESFITDAQNGALDGDSPDLPEAPALPAEGEETTVLVYGKTGERPEER